MVLKLGESLQMGISSDAETKILAEGNSLSKPTAKLLKTRFLLV